MGLQCSIIYDHGLILASDSATLNVANVGQYLALSTLGTYSVTVAVGATAPVLVTAEAGQSIVITNSSFKSTDTDHPYALYLAGAGTITTDILQSIVIATPGVQFLSNSGSGDRIFTIPLKLALDDSITYTQSGDDADLSTGLYLVGTGKSYQLSGITSVLSLYVEDATATLVVESERMVTIDVAEEVAVEQMTMH
jgi:hypothetical protein